jgi:hypothetical protein
VKNSAHDFAHEFLQKGRYTHPADELKQSAVEILLKGRKGLVPATELLKSPEGQNRKAANQGRSIA